MRPRAAFSFGRRRRLDELELAQRAHQRAGVGGRRDDVEVLDRVGLPARRPGELDALGRGVRAQRRDDLLADRQRAVQQHALRRALADAGVDRRQHRGLELRPEALDVAQLVASAAARSIASESMPSSVKSLRARLGPRPGSRVISSRPGGYFARSFSAAGIVPVSSSATSFSSSVLPMPGSDVTVPARVSAATDTVASRAPSPPSGRRARGARSRRRARRGRRARRRRRRCRGSRGPRPRCP